MAKVFFTFDRDAYQTGGNVAGKVTLELDKPLSAQLLIINWSGISQTEGISFLQKSEKYWFYGTKVAWMTEDGNQIPAGHHEYVFSFDLPQMCPPTFKGSLGENKYLIEMVFERPSRLQTRVEKEFVVTKTMEHMMTRYKIGKKYNHTESYAETSLKLSGLVELEVVTPNKALKYGESFQLEYEIHNDSNVAVTRICAEFYSREHYHAGNLQTSCRICDLCPLSSEQQKTTPTKLGYKEINVCIHPHLQGAFVMPFVIPKEVKTPSFETGLMTCGYEMIVGLKMEKADMNAYDSLYITLPLIVFVGDAPQKKRVISFPAQKIKNKLAPLVSLFDI